MEVKIVASTQIGYEIKKEEIKKLSGMSAGICYMPHDFDTLSSEPCEKTFKRAEGTLKSGHHSCYDHAEFSFVFENIPKILAMILNNEGMYTTSEKSARYTKMEPSPKELELYNKWLDIFIKLISEKYGEKFNIYYGDTEKASKAIKKLAQENARYMLSVFTNTTMMYTVSVRQLNYIISFFERFIEEEEDTSFNIKVKEAMKEFINKIPDSIKIDGLNSKEKDRKISLFDDRKNRKEIFSESYSTTYKGTFAEYAQAQRHRTLTYKLSFLDEFEYYIPEILKEDENLMKMWGEDIKSVADIFPQGMLVRISERGTYEMFILKCKERLCGCAQLEIALQTKDTLNKYIEATKENDKEIYEELIKYSKGARCTFPKFNCGSRCIWGAKEALDRKI